MRNALYFVLGFFAMIAFTLQFANASTSVPEILITEVWIEPVTGLHIAYKEKGVLYATPGNESIFMGYMPKRINIEKVALDALHPDYLRLKQSQSLELSGSNKRI